MNKLTFLLILLFFSTSTFSQTDSKPVISTTSDIIKKGRDNLTSYIQNEDYQKVKSTWAEAFKDVDKAEYLTIFPEEAWLMYIFIDDYKTVIEELEKVNKHSIDKINKLKLPEDDDLYLTLQSKARKNKISIINKINDAELKPEQKEILILCFNNLTADEKENSSIQDEINKQANSFIEKYNNSSYNYYVKNFVRYEYTISPFGWGFEFYSGMGFYSNELKRSFTDHWSFGFAFDFYYKKYNLHLSQYIATSKTRKILDYDNTKWNKDSKASIFLPEFSIGYLAYQNKIIRLRPTAGLGYLNVSPTAAEQEKDPLLRNLGINSVTYSLGVTCDFIIAPKAVQISSWYIRLRYNYYIPQYTKKYPTLSGNFHSITIGIGGFTQNKKRLN